MDHQYRINNIFELYHGNDLIAVNVIAVNSYGFITSKNIFVYFTHVFFERYIPDAIGLTATYLLLRSGDIIDLTD